MGKSDVTPEYKAFTVHLELSRQLVCRGLWSLLTCFPSAIYDENHHLAKMISTEKHGWLLYIVHLNCNIMLKVNIIYTSKNVIWNFMFIASCNSIIIPLLYFKVSDFFIYMFVRASPLMNLKNSVSLPTIWRTLPSQSKWLMKPTGQ